MSVDDREMMRMKYAFAMHLVTNVIEADSIVVDSERDFFQECFPEELIDALDLSQPEQRAEMLTKALDELPRVMNLEQRLDIFGMVLGASVADGDLEFREFGVLEIAAKALHIPEETMLRYFEATFELSN